MERRLIGIGDSTRLRPCHTTRHAGPHRAVRGVEVCEPRYAEVVEIRQGKYPMNIRETTVPPSVPRTCHKGSQLMCCTQAPKTTVNRGTRSPVFELDCSECSQKPFCKTFKEYLLARVSTLKQRWLNLMERKTRDIFWWNIHPR